MKQYEHLTSTEVKIEDFEYKPKDLVVKKGTMVKWRNYDEEGHTVTSYGKVPLNSDLLEYDDTYEHQFNDTGEYRYYCVPHPFMKGSVTVLKN